MNDWPYAIIEPALNAPFRLDREARHGLGALNGRIVRLHVTNPAWACELVFEDERIRVRAPSQDTPTVTLSGSPGQFLALLRARVEQTQKVMAGGLGIDGDVDCALAVKTVFERASIDWEEVLAGALGDVPAHLVAQAARRVARGARYAAWTLAGNAAAFLTEDAGILAVQRDIEDFVNAVDVVRDDAERLAQRVARIKAR